MAWLFRPVSVAGMSRVGRYLQYEVAGLARIGGRYEPYWPGSYLQYGAIRSRSGRYLPYGVAVLGRSGGRYESYWPLVAVCGGCSGPYRWPL